jgi:hypothetical protein
MARAAFSPVGAARWLDTRESDMRANVETPTAAGDDLDTPAGGPTASASEVAPI